MTLKYPKQTSGLKLEPQFKLTHTVPAILVRYQGGGYTAGVWQDAEESRTTIYVNVQPMRGHELMQMPEAERSREWRKFYTVSSINGVKDSTDDGTRPDKILLDGVEYEVARVSEYTMGILNHTKIIAAAIRG